MTIFQCVTDATLVERITAAQRRVVFVAPAVTRNVAKALAGMYEGRSVSVTVILDSDEDAYRIGFGDPEGLAHLHAFAKQHGMPLRRQVGLRIGLLVVDDVVTIWSPTPKAVEAERQEGQPNAIVLGGAVAAQLQDAVGAEQSHVLPTEVQIGNQPLRTEDTDKMVKALKKNPPESFDLSQKTRVFSTRFQFVEFEIRGAECTERRIKLSSLLLNADLPESLQDILETQVHPFQTAGDLAFNVPHLVNGRPAYEQDGSRMMELATQSGIAKAWAGIRDRYLRYLKGFGWLIRRDRLQKFRAEVAAYEETLRAWVLAFREHVENEENRLVQSIVDSISSRLERSTRRNQLEGIDLKAEVQKGLQRLRVIEPKVRIVLKNVSWESSRDKDFTAALEHALPNDELAGWFEEFTAAKGVDGCS